MARYRMDDGTIVDTDKASRNWHEAQDHDGSNPIGRITRDQWSDQTLYRSRKGRYYVEHTSRRQGDLARVEWVSPEEATRWLLLNDSEIPDELRPHVDEVSE